MFLLDAKALNMAAAWSRETTVTEEVLIFLKSSSNYVRTMARAELACGQSNYRLCPGDCGYCPWTVQGRMVSIDKDCAHCFRRFECDAVDVEELVAARDSLDRAYKAAAKLNACCGTILQMHYEYNYQITEIAEELDMDSNRVKYWLKRSLKHLRENAYCFCDETQVDCNAAKGGN